MSEAVLDSRREISRASTSKRRRAIVADIIGTVVEWYDYAVYGYLATILATILPVRQ